jgi:hypothetical protein
MADAVQKAVTPDSRIASVGAPPNPSDRPAEVDHLVEWFDGPVERHAAQRPGCTGISQAPRGLREGAGCHLRGPQLARGKAGGVPMTTLTKAIPMALITAAVVLAPPTSRAQSTDALSDGVKTGVEEALQDEYRGEAMYSSVLKAYGDLRPFSNVVRAERQHATFLEDLLKARNLAVPRRREAAVEAPGFASVKDACTAAVEFETRNVALYDSLIAAGPLPDDVKQAFDHNRLASRDRHKPAFERCAGVATAHGASRGLGRGWGAGRGRRQAFGHRAGHVCGGCTGHGCGSCGQGYGCGECGCGRP